MAETLQIPAGLKLLVDNGKVVLIAEGDVILEGPIQGSISRLESTKGTITLRGPLQIEHVVAQAVRIEGHLVCSELLAKTGAIQMRGRLEADNAVAAQGDIVVRGPTNVGVLRAGGTLRVDGPKVEARLLSARHARFRGGTIKARAIEAQERIFLGPCAFTVEVAIAPQVEIDTKAVGRINVLESHNELGPNGLKGRFRLQEYGEFTGVDPEAFLAEREVRPLEELGSAAISAGEGDSSGLEELGLRTADEPTDHGERVLAPTPNIASPPIGQDAARAEQVIADEPVAPTATQTSPAEQSAPSYEPESVFDMEPEAEPEAAQPEPLDLAAEHIEPLPDPAPAPGEPVPSAEPPFELDMEEEDSEAFEPAPADPEPLSFDDSSNTLTPAEDTLALSAEDRSFLDKTVARLNQCYPSEPPAGISRLRTLVGQQDYGAVKHELKEIFNGVVRGHISVGTRPEPEVLAGFNAIHNVMKRA